MKKIMIRLIGLYLNIFACFSPRAAGKLAFSIFCRPVRSRITLKQKSFFQSAQPFSMDYEGVAVRGYRWGSGHQNILFLHGWQSNSYRWKAYIDALPKDQYTIYALDAPGHGQSGGDFLTVPVYSSVIRQVILQLGSVDAVIGHSIGSFSMLYTLFRFPLLPVKSVIALAPPGEATDFVDVFKATLGLSRKVVGLIEEQFVDQYDVKPDFFSAVKFASHLNMKGLIIHDEEDREAPFSYASSIHHAWKRSRLITTKGFGHNLRSPVVVSHVVDFISADGETAHFATRHPASHERI